MDNLKKEHSAKVKVLRRQITDKESKIEKYVKDRKTPSIISTQHIKNGHTVQTPEQVSKDEESSTELQARAAVANKYKAECTKKDAKIAALKTQLEESKQNSSSNSSSDLPLVKAR